jgi:lipid-binding SYLF domain-containing protein
MTHTSRRSFLFLAGGAGLVSLGACGNGIGSRGGQTIDARADTTLNYLYTNYPEAKSLSEKAAGVLVMPLVTEAGLGFGGSYGRGALRVDGATVDYYAQHQASFGLQIGAQQYAHCLFFMTNTALTKFRTSHGWVAGADIKYAITTTGDRLSADTVTAADPVVAVVFGQAGLLVGATLEGTKYTRVIP